MQSLIDTKYQSYSQAIDMIKNQTASISEKYKTG